MNTKANAKMNAVKSLASRGLSFIIDMQIKAAGANNQEVLAMIREARALAEQQDDDNAAAFNSAVKAARFN